MKTNEPIIWNIIGDRHKKEPVHEVRNETFVHRLFLWDFDKTRVRFIGHYICDILIKQVIKQRKSGNQKNFDGKKKEDAYGRTGNTDYSGRL